MTIDRYHLTAGPAVLLFGCGQHADRLSAECASDGWRVHSVALPAEPADPVEQIIDFLAHPDSPDRAVLFGLGEVGAAALTVAEWHPERVTAVVALGASAQLNPAEVSCPALVLAAQDTATVLPRVSSFLAELARQHHKVTQSPVKPPVLTPTLLNDSDTLNQLRAAGPVHRVSLAGATPTWVLTGHEVATATLADPRLIGEVEMTAGFRLSPPGANDNHRGEQDLVTINADEHARLRRLVAQHLTPRRVDALRPRIQRETDRLLDAIDPDNVADLVESFARPLPIIVLCELLGIPEPDRGYIHDWLIHRMTAWPPDPHSDVDDYLSRLIAAKRVRPGADLISAVVQTEGAQLDEPLLISAARWIMVGGHRAPMTLLANGVAALLREPEQWRRLVDDPGLIEPAVEELLRYVTPFPVGLARHVAAPMQVGDVHLAEGSLVAASLVAANHDPTRFTDPEAFDITRAVNPHLAFGHGHHYCIGAALARVETQIAVGTLARRFPKLTLAHDQRSLHYRQNRMRYLLELPVVLGADRQRLATGVRGPNMPPRK